MSEPYKLFGEFVEPRTGGFTGDVRQWEVEKFPFHALITERKSGEFNYRLFLCNAFGSPLPVLTQGNAQSFNDARQLIWEEVHRYVRSLRYFIRENEDE